MRLRRSRSTVSALELGPVRHRDRPVWTVLAIVGITGAALFFPPAPLAARQTPIRADRPGLGDGAGVLPTATWQLEAGAAWLFGPSGLRVGEALVRYGMRDFEIRVYPNSAIFGNGGGLENLGVGLKVPASLAGEPIAVVAGVDLPTGMNDAAASGVDFFAHGVWEGTLQDPVGITLQAGVRGDLRNDLTLVLIATPSVAVEGVEGLTAYAGLAAYVGVNDAVFLEGGLARVLDPDTQVDVNVGLSDGGRSFLGVGLSRRWR